MKSISDKISQYLADQTASIERGPLHMRSIRADTMQRDWEKKEQMLLLWVNGKKSRPHPFNGEINAFDIARCRNHFAALAVKYRELSHA